MPIFESSCLSFCCWVVGVLYIFWILIPYQIYDLQYFLPSCGLPFYFGYCLLTYNFCFNFSWSPSCLFFSFHTFASYIIAKKIISSPKSWFAFPSVISDKTFILFYSKSFIISGLHLGPWFTFELIFVYGAESTFILLHMDIQFSQHHLSKGGFSLFLQHFKLHICCLISSVQQPHKASKMDFLFLYFKMHFFIAEGLGYWIPLFKLHRQNKD